jgi:hypothetical protein
MSVTPRDKNDPSCLSVNKSHEGRAGHSSFKASLRRFNFVSTPERECGDGLQKEQHVFWATMMDILPENSKKDYPKSVADLCKASVTS